MASRILRTAPAKRTGPFHRVIGSTDALGQGTLHSVVDVNPFVLFDDPNSFSKKNTPPFGLHPHFGLQVTTIVWDGTLQSQVPGEEKITISAPASLTAFAGRGMAHDESSATDDLTQFSQIIWMIPHASLKLPARVEQLKDPKWISTGEGSQVFVNVGSAFGVTTNITTETKLNLLAGKLSPKASVSLPQIHGGCYFYPMTGSVEIEKESLAAKNVAILNDWEGTLNVTNTSDEEVRYIYGNGERIEQPWVKLLTQNGFFIAPDLAEAQRQEELSKQVGLANYGK